MGTSSDSYFRKIFKSGAIVFFGYVLEMGISLLAKILAARWLDRTGFGEVAVGATLLSTLSAFVLLGIHNGVGRYLPRYDDEQRRRGVLISAFQIVVPVSVVVAGAVAVFAELIAVGIFDSPDLVPILRIFAIAVPFLAITKLALGGMQGSQKSVSKVLIEHLGPPTVRFALVVTAIALGSAAVGIAWAYTLARVLPALLGLYFLYRHTSLFARIPYVPIRKELLVFSAPLMITAGLGRILADLDTYLLGYYVNLDVVGVYNVVYPIATMTGFVLSSFSYLTMPLISEMHADDRVETMRSLYQGVTKWIFLGTLPLFVGFIGFPEVAITLLFGQKYVDGAAALQVLVFAWVVKAGTGPNEPTLTAVGETRALMWLTVVAAVLNVVLNVVLIPPYGLIGAAVATVLSLGLLHVLISTYLYRVTGVQPISAGLVKPAVFGVAAFGLLFVVGTRSLDSSLLAAVTVGLLFVPIYAVGLVRFGAVEAQEVMIVESVEDRFDVDLERVKRIATWLSEP